MLNDAWRAFLLVVVVVALREPRQQPTAPFVQNQYHYQPPVVVNAEPQPIRRIGRAVVELAESFIGAVR